MPRSQLNTIKYFIIVTAILATGSYGLWLTGHDRILVDATQSVIAFVTTYLLCSILLLALNGIRKSDVALITYTLTMMALNGQILLAQNGLLDYPYFATAGSSFIGMLAAIAPIYISNVRQAAQHRRAADRVSRNSLSGLKLATEMALSNPPRPYGIDAQDARPRISQS